MKFQAPRGTYDRLPQDQAQWSRVTDAAQQAAERFGYGRIDTPLFEDARLFVRGIGEVTDIVEKETYTFDDRGGDPLTLRAEGTAPVCRAYLEHGMHNLPQPVRLFYFCPVFRYERPQAGRYRQHHQFGIEVIGSTEPEVDAEVIDVAWSLLSGLGITDLKLLVNTMGDMETRPAFVAALQAYFRRHIDAIPEEIRDRVETNPLRVLDSKDPRMAEITAAAPRSVDHLGPDAGEHWAALLGHLDALGIPYQVEHSLVRGFDYYTRTVFEIVPPGSGSQSTIIGGGRYDGLIEQLGGKPTPGMGFGMGIERVVGNLPPVTDVPTHPLKVIVAHMGDEARSEAVALAAQLRRAGTPSVVAPARGLKSQLRYASSIEASHALILGEDELRDGTVTARNFATKEQHSIARDELPSWLAGDTNAGETNKEGIGDAR
jgi:histidyl-tRNA synthetase